jgi:DNA polymerase
MAEARTETRGADGARDRAARQQLETARLLGVDFAPLTRVARTASDDATVAPAAEVSGSPTDASEEAQGDKPARLAALRERYERESPLVRAIEGWTNIVFGEGDPDARLMFIGEAPGAEEDRTGRPFVGRAGRLLDQMIGAMGLSREAVYIANVLKVRPPNNRTPTPEEWDADGPFLREQIRIIGPEAIVTLGKPAANYLLETRASMSSLRGRWSEAEGALVMPTFHPAYLLRQYTPENRRKVWSDLKKVMDRLGLQAPEGKRD